jgi:hypothetical protein
MAVEPLREARTKQGGWLAALGTPAEWLRDIAISVVTNIWIALMGPFGAYHLTPVAARLVTYLSMCLVAVIGYGLSGRLAVEWGRRRGWPAWLCLPASVLLMSVPMSRLVAFVVPTLAPAAADTAALEWYRQTITLMLPVSFAYLVAYAIWGRRASLRIDASVAPEAGLRPRLARRISAGLGADVVALQAEDHYVRVHTQSGSELLLMRLSDAIAELDGLPGLRVHRSWWVASEAIVGREEKGRNLRLRLRDGLLAPVARKAAADVKALIPG